MRFVGLCLIVSFIGSHAPGEELPRGLVAEQPQSEPYVKVDAGYMVPYAETIPGTDVSIEMIPVPGGVFTFGSPAGEEDRGDMELEAVEVELPPFWIAKHEITWSAYWEFMKLSSVFAELESLRTLINSTDAEHAKSVIERHPALSELLARELQIVDGVTAPTPLYDESTTYEFGRDPDLPATTMTPYAAMQFTKWLSRTTGAQYRLPTEAEWEFAARGGSPKNEVSVLDEVAWYEDNSDWETKQVGQKEPNPYGLYDMLGNVAEIVIDEYDEEIQWPDKKLTWEEAVRWASSNEARVCRGGFYDSPAEECRVTSRFYSEDSDWKASDPNLPLSPWWYADYPASGVGMRIVRSLDPLSPELVAKFWETDSDEIAEDVASRLSNRRGKLGPANTLLPKAQAELKEPSVRELLDDN